MSKNKPHPLEGDVSGMSLEGWKAQHIGDKQQLPYVLAGRLLPFFPHCLGSHLVTSVTYLRGVGLSFSLYFFLLSVSVYVCVCVPVCL